MVHTWVVTHSLESTSESKAELQGPQGLVLAEQGTFPLLGPEGLQGFFKANSLCIYL